MDIREENLNLIYEKALELIENKRLSEGRELLEKIYISGNRNVDGLNILGVISCLYCEFEEAKKYWKESIELGDEYNEAYLFLDDINSSDFESLKDKYKKSIELIENENYEEAIKIIENIEEERKEFLETKEILSLLYMLKNKQALALSKIKLALDKDVSNIKFKSIYENIKNNITSKEEKNGSLDYDLALNFTFSEVILNLIMILNYKINEVYEEEIKLQNEKIYELEKRLELKEI